jgi:hypothetical protein
MKKSNLISIFVSGLLIMAGLSAQAASFDGGNSGGGGGDIRCSEYSDMVGRIALVLNNIGQEKVSETLSVVNVKDLWQIKKGLRCIPASKLNRQAFSVPSTRITRLMVEEWQTLSQREKYRLATHELAVLAELEGDGEYFISDELLKIIRESGKLAIEPVVSEMLTKNPDGSVTYFQPQILNSSGVAVAILGDHDSSFTSLCMFLGYKKDFGGDYQMFPRQEELAWTKDGRLSGFGNGHNSRTIRSVTCK